MKQRNRHISNENHRLARVFNDMELSRVRRRLSKEVFYYFYQKYARSFEIEIYEKLDPEFIKLEDRSISFRIGDPNDRCKEFAVGLHYCQCQDSVRSGLACRHLLAIRRYFKMPYLDLINPRWFIREIKYKTGFRPKKSRRHQISK